MSATAAPADAGARRGRTATDGDRPRYPNLIVIGAPKCATTSFYHYLAEHPDIVCPLRKESNFLLHGLFDEADLPDDDAVRAAIASAPPARYYADVAALYVYHDGALARARALPLYTRFLVFVRDPVELLHSLHGEALKRGDETEEDPARAIADEHWQSQARLTAATIQVPYRHAAHLAAAVQPWLDAFGDRVRVVHFDDVRDGLQATYDGITDWLGLPRHRLTTTRVHNPDARIRNVGLHRMMRRPPAFIRRPLHAVLPRTLRDRIGKRLERLNRKRHERTPLDADLRARLEAEFAEDIAFVERFRRTGP